MTSADLWDPGTYDRFADERSAPFFDLLNLVQGTHLGRVVDLGCGTGRLTRTLHERVGATETLGVDSSAAMLEEAAGFAGDGLDFVACDIGSSADLDRVGAVDLDLVFSNAAFQWVPRHPDALADVARRLRPGGQLAIQVPANGDHPSHEVARVVAAEAPFAEAYSDSPPSDSVTAVLAPERYAELLHAWGFIEQHVRLQVYPHLLDSTDEVVTWVEGTLLHRYLGPLPDELHDEFVARYRARLRERLGDDRPYFYAYKRILFWGRRPI
jgi:trans-aconitate 2-methyltransferase